MKPTAKLPLALLAVLAMLFLMPGLARADGSATATGSATDSTAAAASTDTQSNAAALATETQSSAAATTTGALPSLRTCTDPSQLPDCLPPCQLAAFKDLPGCSTTPSLPSLPSPPPSSCRTLADLPHCTPDCQFLASLLHQDICTTLPQCLDPSMLPPNFPVIPGVPVCEKSSPSTTAPPSGSPGGVYYKNCDDARAHGASNIHKGQPGYRPGLDSDHDGIACETSTSRGTPPTPAAATPAPQPVAAPVVHQLAYTGAVPAPVALAGLGLVLGGAGLLRLSRRPR